jgi:hypothetical protein
MFFNIIIFFIILIILTLILTYSNDYKEGFLDLPVKHNQFVKESQVKFNELTNTINLTNPNIPLSVRNTKAFETAIGGIVANPTSDTFNLEGKNEYPIPTDSPATLKLAESCQAKGPTCDAFDDPVFAANCGISFDVNGMGSDGKPKIGGMFISIDERKKQTDAAENVKTTGSAPYDPVKVFRPTLGKSKPGTFSITKDQCKIVKEKVDCESKQTFSSPNCSQCYTSQDFSRVDPKTTRQTSTLFLFGRGVVNLSSSNNKIKLQNTRLDMSKATTITIAPDAEGTQFIVKVFPAMNDQDLPFIAGYLQGKTSRGNFKIDLNSLIQSDQVSNSKPKLSGTIRVDGFRSLSIIPAVGQTTISLACLMPFSFINIFDSDAIYCDNGPFITNEASATFLESDPCFGKANKPGNYKLECLQARWLALGGTQQGTGYPSNKQKADAIQLDGAGNPLSIDDIVDNLAIKIQQAYSGTDQNGNSLSINDWNTVSMFATGVPINTPCDGPNKNTGPLSKDCLNYLYLNKGVTSHIGPTYTLTPSQVASMKGQNTPNTYCQPGTEIDPNTSSGLEFSRKLGGINAVKQTYDQINRLANDNTKSNQDRAQAVKQCYGVSLNSMASQKTQGPVQVFAVAGPGGQSYKYTKSQAEQVCSKYGAKVATSSQLKDAQKNGADWCFTGWVSDSNSPQYPITTRTYRGCGQGNSGIQSWGTENGRAGVNCYGSKPDINDYEVGEILPFSETEWNQPQDGQTRYGLIANGYLETDGPQPSCFSNLTVEQAQANCNNLGSKCVGFSFSKGGNVGSGCYKGNHKAGMNNNSAYVGYVKIPQP